MSTVRHQVLHIEDNELNRVLMRHLFKRAPHLELVEVDSAEAGFDHMVTEIPALILMDIQLPGMDGYAALQLLRSKPETRHIPVIAISSFALARDIEKGLKAGFDEYITKPIRVGALLDIVQSCLESKQR
ncbi:CheY-like chemotaxis protein [Paenibacillus shirakamiensis]|uniref:CheY-like chemotaxis protein n=1 Tax=Paenibacillus shirakamiensis TaxID=1265935 RepID=A0ABS4JG26_9BACL|nr:response regulator [Paenibacillus shirakamiensis]MBP2000660.1 CheY-like chemotaxis protein [Paenibacillus shirakamiensis]